MASHAEVTPIAPVLLRINRVLGITCILEDEFYYRIRLLFSRNMIIIKITKALGL